MSRAAERPRPSPVWLLVVVAMIGLALAGPIIMIRDQLADDPAAAPTAAEGAQPVAGAAAGGGTVKMAGLTFAPGTLTVARGTEVVFENKDVAPHTVTARSGGVDSGVLAPGKSVRPWVSTVPSTTSARIHPSMTARIVLSG